MGRTTMHLLHVRSRYLPVLPAPARGGFPHDDGAHKLIATGLPETFVTYLKLSVYGGFFLAFPTSAWAGIHVHIAPGPF